MDISQLLPLLTADKSVKHAIENLTKQPSEHIIKCLGNFISDIKSGPGLVNKVAEQQTIYNKIFQAGISMGFPDYECVIAASGYAGYSPVDIVTFFRNQYGWDNVTIEEVEMIGKNLAPKFRKKLIQYGYIKEDEEVPQSGIPKLKENKTYGNKPPWRNSEDQNSTNN
jgi:hypothetical protein